MIQNKMTIKSLITKLKVINTNTVKLLARPMERLKRASCGSRS